MRKETRYLTPDDCTAFGPPGAQNEVTPAYVIDGRVPSVFIWTAGLTGRNSRLVDHGTTTYRRLVEASDDRLSETRSNMTTDEAIDKIPAGWLLRLTQWKDPSDTGWGAELFHQDGRRAVGDATTRPRAIMQAIADIKP